MDNYYNYEQKTIIKASLLSGSANSYESMWFDDAEISIERKLTPAISAEVGWVVPHGPKHNGYLNLRYYFAKRPNSKNKYESANNFTGDYLSVGVLRSFKWRPKNHFFYEPNEGRYGTNTFSLGIGRQEKLGRFGFVDMGAAVEYNHFDKSLQVGLKLKSGLAWGPSRLIDPDSEGLGQTNTYEEERGLFKVGMPSISLRNGQLIASIHAEYELALMRDVSLVAGLNMHYFHQSSGEISIFGNALDVNSDMAVRYYYNTRKKLNRNKTLRSFEGNYVSLKMSNVIRYYHRGFNTFPTTATLNVVKDPKISLLWGVQERIGKKGFLNFEVGPSYDTRYGFGIDGRISAGLKLF